MPTLDDLRNKWFIKFDSSNSSFPPVSRHMGTNVSNYTDGNRVVPIIDGQNYMKIWHDSIRNMIGKSNCEIYHSAWRQEAVRTLGNSIPSSGALVTLKDAQNGGVTLYLLFCRNLSTYTFNARSVIWLRTRGVWRACLDNRFPPSGSNHQKFVCLKDPSATKAMMGSIDISIPRWDTTLHLHVDPNRDPAAKPTHDVGIVIEGPAVTDLEWSFRERWNDSTRTLGLKPLIPPLPKINTPVSSLGSVGTHSVQVLHTYGITSTFFGYSWSPAGEFTIWASYLGAIKTANNYIYIEDQFFLPFGDPTLLKGQTADTDIIYQLGEAIKRGVKVAVLVPSDIEDSGIVSIIRPYQKYQRNIGINYLATIAASHPGDFVIASLHNGVSPIYVHSKIMICDDEFVLVGSANICQRSMTHDSEIHAGIVDSVNQFASELRKTLWSGHLQRPPSELEDPITSYEIFKKDALSNHGRLRSYPITRPSKPPLSHEWIMRNLVDPYAGPPRV